MHKGKKEKNFLKKPEYEGGDKALKKFVADNLHYPEEAYKNGIEGSVHLRYSIDHRGIVKDVKVISGIGHGCDEEAVRIVRLFRFTTLAAYKMQVEFHKNIHIHFKKGQQQPAKIITPELQPETPEMAYSYHVTPSPAANKPKEADKNNGYIITIPL